MPLSRATLLYFSIRTENAAGINQDQFKTFLEQVKKVNKNAPDAKFDFSDFDEDKDNLLNKEEWTSFIKILEATCGVEMVETLTSTHTETLKAKTDEGANMIYKRIGQQLQRSSKKLNTISAPFSNVPMSAVCGSAARRTSLAHFGNMSAMENFEKLDHAAEGGLNYDRCKSPATARTNPLAALLHQNKKADLKAIEEILKSDVEIDLDSPIGGNLPTPIFFAVGTRQAGLMALLIEYKADPAKKFSGKMWQGIMHSMTPIQAANSRKEHFIGTVFEEQYSAIEDVLCRTLSVEAPIALHSKSSIKSPCDHYEGSPSAHYIINEKIGEGSFGSVRRIQSKDHPEITRALKTIPKVIDAWVEIDILRDLDHPNILRLYATFEDQHNLYLVMEYCAGGELLDALLEETQFTEELARRVMKQILYAVEYLHHNHVCHRDLKPENILLSNKCLWESDIKIVDFGTALAFDPNTPSMTTKICTLHYVAPEILTKKVTPYTEKCDMWSLGAVLFLLLSGQVPFYHDLEVELMKLIKKGHYSFEDAIWENVSEKSKQLVRSLLAVKPALRASASEALENDWFSETSPKTFVRRSAKQITTMKRNLRSFRAENSLKRFAMRIISSQGVDEHFLESLKGAFMALDTEMTGELQLPDMQKAMENILSDITLVRENVAQAEMYLQECVQLLYEVAMLNGYVNWANFLCAVTDRRQYLHESACRAAFDMYDLDYSGSLDREELRQALCTNHDLAGELLCKSMSLDLSEIDDLLADHDKDRNGEIDFQEFTALILS